MTKGHQILIAVSGVALVGAAVGEHVYRRIIERQYHESMDSRRQLELKFGEVLATHEQLKGDLKHEQEHSHE